MTDSSDHQVLDPPSETSESYSDESIRAKIPQFQWFTHVDFGNGVIAQSTAWPDAPADSRHMGVSKFEFIVRRNLPDLQGKRVLEIGCNAGITSIHMARLGAAEVVGVDWEQGWPDWKEQAEFVKGALEWRCGTRYNVRYIESDMRQIGELDLGKFDIVTALNCIYYLQEDEIAHLVRHVASISDCFLVQCNTRDHDKEVARRADPRFISRVLSENGFPKSRVDWPWDHPRKGILPRRYWRPVVVGTK